MTASTSPAPRDGAHDFDFLFGEWTVHNRRLARRLRGCTEWEEFTATSVARPIWGGAANVDEFHGEPASGVIDGLTLRVYNPASRQWTLTWASRARGVLDPPVFGEFKDGRGEFYNQEALEGRFIYVRFIWSEITASSCRWEQAFSDDGGKTWETNWVMQFIRTA